MTAPDGQTMGPLPARVLRRVLCRPHFKGKSRLEQFLGPVAGVPSVFTHPDGFALTIDTRSALERSIYLCDVEPSTYRFFKEVLRPGGTFWDVGANIGFYSMVAGRLVGPEGRVLAFEPTPTTFERLSGHVRRNGMRQVTPLRMALGSADAEATVYQLDERDHGKNTLRADGLGVEVGTCRVRSPDALIAQGEPPPDAMKLDVEGAELEVLQGAVELLRAHPVRVVVELRTHTQARFGTTPQEVIAFAQTVRPYEVVSLVARPTVVTHAPFLELGAELPVGLEGNYALVPRGAPVS